MENLKNQEIAQIDLKTYADDEILNKSNARHIEQCGLNNDLIVSAFKQITEQKIKNIDFDVLLKAVKIGKDYKTTNSAQHYLTRRFQEIALENIGISVRDEFGNKLAYQEKTKLIAQYLNPKSIRAIKRKMKDGNVKYVFNIAENLYKK